MVQSTKSYIQETAVGVRLLLSEGDMLPTVEQKRRRAEIRSILRDLLHHPSKLEAVTDLLDKLIWDDK